MATEPERAVQARSWRRTARGVCYGIGATVGAWCVLVGFLQITRFGPETAGAALFAGGGLLFVLLGNGFRER
ncbi:unnamed protein product [Gemmata massiliana]|uniref:Uncharacterized protein n=1 Tax=Gemmata massiliana TaxID=1210884 RepID=A0A6P2DAP1_9BACT|nr:hypothetical protein [Gemmata massiliana]VTR97957.1 unnamed protein product [Gemmata massiliana]